MGNVVSVMALGDIRMRTLLGQCEQGMSWMNLQWNLSRVTSGEIFHFSDLHVYKHPMELVLPRLTLKINTYKTTRMTVGEGWEVGAHCLTISTVSLL